MKSRSLRVLFRFRKGVQPRRETADARIAVPAERAALLNAQSSRLLSLPRQSEKQPPSSCLCPRVPVFGVVIVRKYAPRYLTLQASPWTVNTQLCCLDPLVGVLFRDHLLRGVPHSRYLIAFLSLLRTFADNVSTRVIHAIVSLLEVSLFAPHADSEAETMETSIGPQNRDQTPATINYHAAQSDIELHRIQDI